MVSAHAPDTLSACAGAETLDGPGLVLAGPGTAVSPTASYIGGQLTGQPELRVGGQDVPGEIVIPQTSSLQDTVDRICRDAYLAPRAARA